MIYIDNRQASIMVDERLENLLEKTIEFTLSEEGVNQNIQISIIIVDNKEIAEINNEFRGINKATDVLSFPMLEFPEHRVFKEVYKGKEFDDSYMDGEELVLGDMAISLEKAREQCEEYGHSYEREVAYLTVHSILHLLGYDHMEDEDKIIMRNREEDILNKLNIKRI